MELCPRDVADALSWCVRTGRIWIYKKHFEITARDTIIVDVGFIGKHAHSCTARALLSPVQCVSRLHCVRSRVAFCSPVRV